MPKRPWRRWTGGSGANPAEAVGEGDGFRSMRVLKEVLVLAVIVLAFAYAARRLEGVDAGEITAGVPPLMQTFKQMLGWDDKDGERASDHQARSHPAATPGQERAAP